MTFNFNTEEQYLDAYMYLIRILESFSYNRENKEIHVEPIIDPDEVYSRLSHIQASSTSLST